MKHFAVTRLKLKDFCRRDVCDVSFRVFHGQSMRMMGETKGWCWWRLVSETDLMEGSTSDLENNLLMKNRWDMGILASCWAWAAVSVWTFGHFRCIAGVKPEDKG